MKSDEDLRLIALTRARLDAETRAVASLLQERKIQQMRVKEEEIRLAGEVAEGGRLKLMALKASEAIKNALMTAQKREELRLSFLKQKEERMELEAIEVRHLAEKEALDVLERETKLAEREEKNRLQSIELVRRKAAAEETARLVALDAIRNKAEEEENIRSITIKNKEKGIIRIAEEKAKNERNSVLAKELRATEVCSNIMILIW